MKIHVIFAFLSCIVHLNAMDGAIHHVPKRGVASAINALKTTIFTLKRMYSGGKNLAGISNTGLKLVENIPVIGDIVSLFTSNPSGDSGIENKLDAISDDLQALSKNVESIGNKVEKLSNEIDLSVLKNQVANAKLKISNCRSDFLLMLKNPGSKAEQDRVRNCYTKFEYARQIGSLLKDEKLTFMQKTLFDQIIDYTGYCNGKNINDVYQYLLGLYIEGCTAFVSAEILSYNSGSTTYKSECTQTLQLAETKRLEIYNKCKKDSCDLFIPEMTRVLSLETGISIKEEFHRVFPWYTPVIILFQENKNPHVVFYGGNRLALKTDTTMQRLIMWFSKPVSTSGIYTVGVEYDINSVHDEINEMALKEDTFHRRTALTGTYSTNQTTCVKEGTPMETSQQNNELAAWAIALIAIGSIIFLIVIICICRRYRRYVRERDEV